jgi:hypothetical protein
VIASQVVPQIATHARNSERLFKER